MGQIYPGLLCLILVDITSIIILSIPLAIIFSTLIDELHIYRIKGFYDYSTLLTLCHTLMLALYFLLEKIIKYKSTSQAFGLFLYS